MTQSAHTTVHPKQAKYHQHPVKEPQTTNQMALDPRKLKFNGSGEEFKVFVQGLTSEQKRQCEEMELTIVGEMNEQIQQERAQTGGSTMLLARCCPDACVQGCACLVCLFSCIIFVLFFWIIIPVMYCCAKSKIQKAFDTKIQLSTYQTLHRLSSQLLLKKLSIILADNHLNKEKLDCIRQFIQHTLVAEIQLENKAIVFDQSSQQWANFQENAKGITSLTTVHYVLRWQGKVLQK